MQRLEIGRARAQNLTLESLGFAEAPLLVEFER
jgi:hypothetical protein